MPTSTPATPDQVDANPVRRSRGRPRDPRVEGAVLDATRELLLARGFGGLTIAAVAEAAGVGKGTIYLRWPDKESLVVSALAEVWKPVDDPDTGSLRADLLAITGQVTDHFNGDGGLLFTAVIGEMTRHHELKALWVNNVITPWHGVMMAVFKRGVDRGEMRPGIDTAVAIDALMGPILATSAVRGQRISRKQTEAFVDIFLGGVAA